jgi:5'-nucleotidase
VIVTRRPLGGLLALFVLGPLALVAACTSDSKPSAASSASSASSAAPPLANAPRPLSILVTNDDGAGAPGIDAVVQALRNEPATQVTVVAPAANQSGVGGNTSPGPVTATRGTTASGYPATFVNGTPVDSVVYALATVLSTPPDLVVSGANMGQNVGPNIKLSGTVGAARAAAQRGIPAIAVSAAFGDPVDYSQAASMTDSWVRDHRDALLASHAAPTTVTNLNVPSCGSAGHVRGQVSVTPELTASPGDAIQPADCTSTAPAASTDVTALHDGFATLSDIGLEQGS